MSKRKVSAAQLAANRANGLKSTGPRTAEGKAKVAANALKHGLLAEHAFIDLRLHSAAQPEDHRQYHAILAALTADLNPSGPLETQYLQRLASLQLRLARIIHIESGMFAQGIDDTLEYDRSYRDQDARKLQEHPTERLLATAYNRNGRSLNQLTTYEARLARDFQRTLVQLRQSQQIRSQRFGVDIAVQVSAQAHVSDSTRPEVSNQSMPLPSAAPSEQPPNPTASSLEKICQTNPISAQHPQATEFHSQWRTPPSPSYANPGDNSGANGTMLNKNT